MPPLVRDASGQAPVYYEQEPGRRAAAKLLTRATAGRIAANVAMLPADPFAMSIAATICLPLAI